MVQQRPTLLDVARLAGVSAKTVSRVVNGEAHVQAHTAQRILEAVAALGYRRNSVAWQLRTGRRTTYIGLVIDDLENPFYSRVARGVEQVVREHDAVLVIGSSEEAPEREQELVRQFSDRRIDGLLLVPAGHGDQRFLAPEIAKGLVVVCIDRPPVGIQTDTVLLDNASGAGLGLDHLVASGCRRIAVLADSLDIYTIRERLSGFNAAAAGAGLVVEPALVVTDLHTPDEAADVVRTLLARSPRPDGFFCCNNRLTVGAVTEVVRQQADVTIVGFDDFELASALRLNVALVSGDERELGRRAARLLLDRLEDPLRRRRRLVLPTQLSIRGSLLADGGEPKRFRSSAEGQVNTPQGPRSKLTSAAAPPRFPLAPGQQPGSSSASGLLAQEGSWSPPARRSRPCNVARSPAVSARNSSSSTQVKRCWAD